MQYQGEAIKLLIPQREPIIMLDGFTLIDTDSCSTRLTIVSGNYFVDSDSKILAETGLIEHIAQSASAMAGYKRILLGESAPVGYLAEIKKFRSYRNPLIGETLNTNICFGVEVNGVTIITGRTMIGEELVAETQMKIFIEN